jgi:hypothetical protein
MANRPIADPGESLVDGIFPGPTAHGRAPTGRPGAVGRPCRGRPRTWTPCGAGASARSTARPRRPPLAAEIPKDEPPQTGTRGGLELPVEVMGDAAGRLVGIAGAIQRQDALARR